MTTSVATRPPQVQRRLTRFSTAGVWASGVAISVSSAVALVALGRHLPTSDLAQVSSVFVLSLLIAVLPTAIQSQSAATRSRLHLAGGLRWTPLIVVQAVLLAASPFVASVTRLPLVAVVSVALQMLPAVAAAVVRGDLIGSGRLGLVTVSQTLEAVTRCVAAVGLGWSMGSAGMAVGLLAGTLVGAITLVGARRKADIDMPVTAVLAGLAAFTTAVNVDVLVVPSLLPDQAGAYALAVLPGKAVFMALVAAGWTTIPVAARIVDRRGLLRVVGAYVVAGLALAVLATAAGPLLAALLQEPPAPVRDSGLLALAMALAGASWGALMVVVARGGGQVWVPGALSLAVLLAAGWFGASVDSVVAGTLGGQALGLLAAFGLAARAISRHIPRHAMARRRVFA